MKKTWKKLLQNLLPSDSQKVFYIITQIIISGIGFAKSLIFMKYLGFYDLGLVTIILTLVSFIKMFQLGLMNGGFRIFSLGIKKDNLRVNNLVFTYIGVLLFFSSLVLCLLWTLSIDLNYKILFIGLIVGILNLCSTWYSTISVALVRLKELNKFNLIASVFSIFTLLTIPYWGFGGVVLTLVLRPLIFLILNFYHHTDFKPTSFIFDFKLVKWVLTFGFIPFLAGILDQFSIQIERWSITGWLGTEELGKFYLPVVFCGAFVLIPDAIRDLYFPQLMKLFNHGKYEQFKAKIKKHFFVLLAFLGASFLSIYFLLECVVLFLFPNHYGAIKYVYAILPGLCALTLMAPITMVFHASVKLKPILIAYLTSAGLTAGLILSLKFFNELTLFNIAIVRSIVGIYICLFFFSSYYLLKNRIMTIKHTPHDDEILDDGYGVKLASVDT